MRASVLLPMDTFDRHEASYRAAFLLIHFDRTDDYRQLCRRLVAEHAKTDDIQIMERLLKMYAFADIEQHGDVPPVLSRFEKHVSANFEREPKVAGIRHWIHQALGIVAYRAGNYSLARDRLRKSNALFEKTGNSPYRMWQTAANLYYLALAAHRAGRTADARKRFAEATDKYASLPPDAPCSAPTPSGWCCKACGARRRR